MAFNFTGGTQTRQRSRVLAIVLLVVSLVCTGIYLREGETGPLHIIQQSISALAGPAKSVSGAISSVEDATSQAMADAGADESTLSGLREQNQQLRQTITQLEEYRQEAERLQGLLNIKDLYDADTITARVLSRTIDPWNLIITIDKGESDGIRAGLPVMGSSGLVGQVVSTTDTTSEVRLLQDPQSGVAVIIQSNRVEGIVRGNLDGLLYLEDVDDDAEVKAGDVVITSGLGGGYFQGIMLGTVSKVEGEIGTASRRIVIEPNAQVKALEEVMVITAMRNGSTGLPENTQTSEGTNQENGEDVNTSTGEEEYYEEEYYDEGVDGGDYA